MQFNKTNLPNRHKNMDNLAQKKKDKDELFIAAAKFKALTGRFPIEEILSIVKMIEKTETKYLVKEENDNRGERTSS